LCAGSRPAQLPPYPPLTEVVAHQTTWTVDEVSGSIVGFRFPHEVQGIEVAGYHLHLLSDDRQVGGHLMGLTLLSGATWLDVGHELHVELPPGVEIPDRPGSDEDIRAVEGG
jgi:acetolactate decarboxylase